MFKQEDLNLRVRFIRETLDMTQEGFAEKAGISYKYYQSIESGLKKDLRLSTLIKLSKACNLPLAELLDHRISSSRLAELAKEYGSPSSSKKK